MGESAEVEFAFLGERDPERAWAEFLVACMGTVERAVRRTAIDSEEARDVVAEVLTRIHADWPALLERYAAGGGGTTASRARASARGSPSSLGGWRSTCCARGMDVPRRRARSG